MVSFFGLKLGTEKKKKSDSGTSRGGGGSSSAPQWKKVDQNSFGEGQFFGANIHKKGVINGSIRDVPSRPGTAASIRNSPYAMQTHNFAASSMYDLSTLPATKEPGLKASASDANLGMRWGNSSSASFAAPPGLGSRPGTPSRPGTSQGERKKPWVNPLDVHFSRNATVPPAQKSPLGQFELQVNVDGTGSLMGDGKLETKTTSPPVITQVNSTSPPSFSPLGPGGLQPQSPPRSYPSSPRSFSGLERQDPPRNLRPVELMPTGIGPSGLPSPALSHRTGSEDRLIPTPNLNPHDGKPVIQNVAAKRDTLTINGPKRQSLSMKIEEFEKSLVNAQQQSEQKKSAGTAGGNGSGSVNINASISRQAAPQMQSNGFGDFQFGGGNQPTGGNPARQQPPMRHDERRPPPSFANRGPRPQSPMGRGPPPSGPVPQPPNGRGMPLRDYDGRNGGGRAGPGPGPGPGPRPQDQRPNPAFANRGPRPQSPMGRGQRGPRPESPMGMAMGPGPRPHSPMGRGPRPESPMGRGQRPESPLGRGPRPHSPMGRGPRPESPMGRGAPTRNPMRNGPSQTGPSSPDGPGNPGPGQGSASPRGAPPPAGPAQPSAPENIVPRPFQSDLSDEPNSTSDYQSPGFFANGPGPAIRTPLKGPNAPRRPAPEEYGVMPRSNSDRERGRGPPAAAVGARRGPTAVGGPSRAPPVEEPDYPQRQSPEQQHQPLHPPPRPQQLQLSRDPAWGAPPSSNADAPPPQNKTVAAPLPSPLFPSHEALGFQGNPAPAPAPGPTPTPRRHGPSPIHVGSNSIRGNNAQRGGSSSPNPNPFPSLDTGRDDTSLSGPPTPDSTNWPLPSPGLRPPPRSTGGAGAVAGAGAPQQQHTQARRPNAPPALNLFTANQYAEEIGSAGPYTPPPRSPQRSMTTPVAACDEPNRPKTAGGGGLGVGGIGVARGLSLRYEKGEQLPAEDMDPRFQPRRPNYGLKAPTGIADSFGTGFI